MYSSWFGADWAGTVQVLSQDDQRVLYRGWRAADGGRHSVLAVLPTKDPTPDFLNRLAHEYGLKDSLDSAWAARPLEFVPERGVLFLEDQGGEPLTRLIGSPMEVGQFLRLAIALSGAVALLHGSGLIHKDIKPGNVLLSSTTGAVWLTGFGIASRVPRERQSPAPPEVIAGTFAYMAPEQTGRMNRSIDVRSDLYALGITLYEMLTGVLPFAAPDPMAWIHCHIARQPPTPAERVTGIPEPLSAIVMKLLAKAAEDRYQTAAGLHADLEHCLETWEASDRIPSFNLGARDASDQLLFQEKLYGREAEITRMLAAFNRVVTEGASELMLVSGYSGIGKSSVVGELHRALVPPRGLFAAGKFDQYKRGIPHATLAQAFQSLVRQLLSKSDAELACWRSALTQALGPNGQLMINLIPELALIIGEQPPVPDLSATEAQSRFLLVFRQFLGVFARQEHPLVLFLDDLQWLDSATLDVFEHLVTQPEVRNLLLVGAYRDNEVGPEHPLTPRLQIIRGSGASVQEVVLGSIRPEDVARMVADALYADLQEVDPLATIIFEKAGGNPFFTIQFVGALADEGLLTYDPQAPAWRWDIDRVRARRVGDNVVDLMIGRLSWLPEASLQALKQLACLGNSVEIAKFRNVTEASEQETPKLLHEALRTGLLLQVDDAYAFAHDRVHEAAYAMLPESERAETHRAIGSRLLAALGDSDLDAQIFDIVSQFNRSKLDNADTADRVTAASLNLRAGRKAKASAAYDAACDYLAKGQAQVGKDGWKSHYELAFALALEHAECTFLSGELDEAARMIALLLTSAATSVDQASVYRLKIELHVVRSENEAAVESGLAALRLFGVEFSPHPSWTEVEREYDNIWKNLNGRPIESFADLPAMTDPEILALMRVLAEIWPPSFFIDFNLMTLTVCRMVNLSLLHGASNTTNQGWALLGWLMGPAFGRYEDGYRIARLASEVAKQRYGPLDMARGGDMMGLTATWTQPLTDAIDCLREAHRVGIEAGDVYFACYPSAHVTASLLLRGHNLREDADECIRYLDFARRIGFRDGADLIASGERTIASLRGLTRGLGDFSDDQFDEAEFEAALSGTRMPVVVWLYWTRKVMLHFLAGNYQAALAAADCVRPEPWLRIILVQRLDYHYYSALALAARMDQVPAEEHEAMHERLAAHYERLKTWAHQTGSPTFADKHILVSAEIARLEGRELEAERLYEDSIRLAHQNGFLQHEAIGNELAAHFYARRGFEKIAQTYLREARSCYLRWGADGKVRQLDERHPHIREAPPAAGATSTTVAPVEHLDLATVIKVSQAVSGEIVLEKLIETLMRTAIEHAGAERGVLILSRGAELQVEAEAVTHGEAVTVRFRSASVAETALPESVIHYVMRTRGSVILSDALAQNHFSDDGYIRQHRGRSLLCLPLMNQAKLIGVLYLENNLSPHVFTASRIAVLKLLASQAAISLENTYLYRDLAEREARIRRLADSNVIGIVIWDLDGRLIDANDAFLDMVQYGREDLKAGLRWFDMTPPEWQEVHALQELEELKATGAIQAREKEYFRKDGSRVPVLIGAAAFDGRPHQGVAYIVDLTELKKAEEKVREGERRYRELQLELAHANRVATMGQLSAWIAHDVKQPLVGVVTSGNAGLRWLAADPPNVETARRSLERIVRDGHRAADILDRIRSLMKKAPLEKKLVDINETISETIVLTRAEAKRNGIDLRTELAIGLPPVSGDRVQLQQVILNLIVNAIEAVSGDTTQRREVIVVSGRQSPNQAFVAVRDSGPGLQQDTLDRLFDAFYTTKPQGMGMGLAISRSIIESHNGRLWGAPNAHVGATFQFNLPISSGETPSSDQA